jgi:hypothetical protein
MAARRTTRRKTTTPRRRSPKPMVNVLKTAESLVLANAATQGLFGMNAVAFATEGWLTPQTSASNNSWELSAAEIVRGLIPGGQGFGFGEQYLGTYGNAPVMAAIKRNIRDNGAQAIGTMVLAPIAFKAARKVLQRPLITPANRLLKSAGMSGLIRI